MTQKYWRGWGGNVLQDLPLLLRMTPASIHASTPWPHHILSPFTLSLTLILICCRVICPSPFLCTPDGATSSSTETGSESLHPTTYPCSDPVPSPLQRLKARSVKYISILEPTLCIGQNSGSQVSFKGFDVRSQSNSKIK